MRIISGGQTGADRGGLDAAARLGLARGGFCPRGRRAEDGRVPDEYPLSETAQADYAERTRQNVEAADATLLFTRGVPTGGSALTAELARRRGKPLVHVDLAALSPAEAVARVRAFLAEHTAETLNVAGSRESLAPGIAAEVREILVAALG